MTMQTDIHILGLGDVGSHLYRDLLISTGHVREIGNVYAYISGNVTEQCDLLHILHEANREKEGITDDLRSSLEKQQRTFVWQYHSLDTLMDVLSQHATAAKGSGRRNILVAARNYDMNYFENSETPHPLPRAFLTTFGADAQWEEQKVQWQQIQRLAKAYADASFSSYMTFLRERHDASFCDSIEPRVREIVKGKKANRASGSGLIGIQQLARAMAQQRKQGGVDSLMDMVFMISNPVDLTTMVYAAETGRDPSSVLCPQNIDRLRYFKHLRTNLNEFINNDEVCAIGPHNHWNMVVLERIFPYFQRRGLSLEQVQQRLEKVAVDVNTLVVENFDRLHRTPSDYYDVLHQAIIDALRDRDTRPAKTILWDPDRQMYIGWMGRLRNGRVLPCEYREVFPANVSPETMARWHAANNTIRAFLDDLVQCGFLSQEQIDELNRKSDEAVKRELDEIYARTPQVIQTTRSSDVALCRILPAGDYVVAAWHEGSRQKTSLHFAFMSSERGVLRVERELSVSGNLTPRCVGYHEKEVYYSHRNGIDAVNVETGKLRRIFSLESQHTTGVTSFIIDGSSLLFTASGEGIGKLDLNDDAKPIHWEYETEEHLDSLMKHNGHYVALCGNGIVKQNAGSWEKAALAETTLEALVAGERLFALGRTDAGLVIVDEYDSYSVPHDNLCGDSGDLRDAEVYGERLKAAVHQNHIVAVGYNGNGFIFNPETKEAQLVSTGLRRVVGFQSHSHGFLISGLDRQTGYLSSRNLRLPYGTIDEVRGLGAVPNKIVSIGGIHLR